jgi:hypothetical protein
LYYSVVSSRLWRRGALVAVCIAAATALYVFKVSPKMADFEVYWRAGVRAAAGEPLYRIEDGHYQFKYLPAFAVLVSPLTLLPLGVARALWYVVSLSSLVGLVATSLRLWSATRHRTWLIAVLTVIVMGKFYGRELLLGQANAMFALVCVAALLAVIRGRDGVAGALVAAGVVLKPYGLLLAPWLIVRRRWRAVTSLLVGLLAAVCLPLVRYSAGDVITLHEQWWTTVRDTTAPNLLSADNVSWLAMYTKWMGSESRWPGPLWLATIAIVCVALLQMWRHRAHVARPEALEGATLLLLVPLVSPQGWDYVLLLATPVVVCLLTFGRDLPARMRAATFAALAIIGLTYYDVIGRSAYGVFMMASGITLATFVLLAALYVLRQHHVA